MYLVLMRACGYMLFDKRDPNLVPARIMQGGRNGFSAKV
jgi:hypothetical protein